MNTKTTRMKRAEAKLPPDPEDGRIYVQFVNAATGEKRWPDNQGPPPNDGKRHEVVTFDDGFDGV